MKKKGIRGVRGLQRQGKKNLEAVCREIFDATEQGGRTALEEFLAKIDSVPNVSLKDVRIKEYSDNPAVPGVEFTNDGAIEESAKVDSGSVKSGRTSEGSLIHIPTNRDCELQVRITCPNSRSASSNSAKSKKPPSWWILLVSTPVPVTSDSAKSSKAQGKNSMRIEGDVELLALKRLGPLRDNQIASLFFTSPEVTGLWPMKVILLNDSFIGIDQAMSLDNLQVD